MSKWFCISAHSPLAILLTIASSVDHVRAQCIPLSDSLLCPAFSAASVNKNLTVYSFLAKVDDATSFDLELLNYMYRTWPVIKYTQQFQCPNFDFSNSYYARYLVTVLCASIVQQSLPECNYGQDAPTICAASCAAYVESEATILGSRDCGLQPSSTIMNILRANFESCATPSSAFNSSKCLEGYENDKARCGFGHNIDQLCAYCKKVLDTCCNELTSTTCTGVVPKQTDIRPLPSITVIPVARPPPATSETTESTITVEPLTTGKLVGIIVSGITALFGFLALIVFLVRRYQRRQSIDNRMHELQSRPRSDALTHVSNSQNRHSAATQHTWSTQNTQQAAQEIEHNLPALPPAIWRSRSLLPSEASSSDTESFALPEQFQRRTPVTYTISDPGLPEENIRSVPRTRVRSNSSLTYATEPAQLLDEHSGVILRPGSLAVCVHAHDPDRDDEISLKVGDIIELTNLYDDRWAKGIRQPRSDEDLARSGAFPIICITASASDSTSRASTHASTDSPTSESGPHGDPTFDIEGSIRRSSSSSEEHPKSPQTTTTSPGTRFREHMGDTHF